jgi:hypothetical protein
MAIFIVLAAACGRERFAAFPDRSKAGVSLSAFNNSRCPLTQRNLPKTAFTGALVSLIFLKKNMNYVFRDVILKTVNSTAIPRQAWRPNPVRNHRESRLHGADQSVTLAA